MSSPSGLPAAPVRQKLRAPLGTRLIQALLFSVIYHSQILIKKIANATHIAANITPYTTDRRNIVLFSPSEPGSCLDATKDGMIVKIVKSTNEISNAG